MKKNYLFTYLIFLEMQTGTKPFFLGLNICDRKWCVSFAFCLELLLNLLWEINGLQHVPLCPALLFAVLWLMAAKKYIIPFFFCFLIWLYSTGHHSISGIIIHPRMCYYCTRLEAECNNTHPSVSNHPRDTMVTCGIKLLSFGSTHQ